MWPQINYINHFQAFLIKILHTSRIEVKENNSNLKCAFIPALEAKNKVVVLIHLSLDKF